MLHLVQHPLITHKLTQIRKKDTGTKDFREALDEIAGLMAYEISRDLPLREVEIETPIAECTTHEMAKNIVLVPILRAGLGMVDGITNLIPTAKVGHVGMYRDHESLEPQEYYAKLPLCITDAVVMVLDPMLATGGSASATITYLKEQGATLIRLVCIVGAPEGVKRIEEAHPDVDIYLSALDDKLNEKGYIVPGLGDAGDRLFGTR
ncbi:MAG: uracil phosphoribosyltransferase [Bacteroidales bacterium]|nr:uracil phosphoribosyltransferase [Bacteroidales bacterium]MDT8432606.1 uracil phosphoribosyltransferase [Bacteroidales bacterium]